MGYIIVYLLLALVIDLIRELINPEGDGRNAVAIYRRLWSDTHFDCRSEVFSVAVAATYRTRRKSTPLRHSAPVRDATGTPPWLRPSVVRPVVQTTFAGGGFCLYRPGQSMCHEGGR